MGVSKCCGAEYYITTGKRKEDPEFPIWIDPGETVWYSCRKCEKACDLIGKTNEI